MTTKVVLNVPDLLVVSNIDNSIEIHGEAVSFKNVNLILNPSTTLPIDAATSLFTVRDDGYQLDVDPRYPDIINVAINTSLGGRWFIPGYCSNVTLVPSNSIPGYTQGYTVSLPGQAVGGLVVTADEIPADRDYTLNQWLSKLVYDNVTYRFLSPADVAGIDTNITYEQHMSAVTINKGNNDNTAWKVYGALKTCFLENQNVRNSLYEQMFSQDPDRFTIDYNPPATVVTEPLKGYFDFTNNYHDSLSNYRITSTSQPNFTSGGTVKFYNESSTQNPRNVLVSTTYPTLSGGSSAPRLEVMAKFTSDVVTNQSVLSMSNVSGSTRLSVFVSSGTFKASLTSGSVNVLAQGFDIIEKDLWYNIAVEINDNELMLFVNDVMYSAPNEVGVPSLSTLCVGGNLISSSNIINYFAGELDELKIYDSSVLKGYFSFTGNMVDSTGNYVLENQSVFNVTYSTSGTIMLNNKIGPLTVEALESTTHPSLAISNNVSVSVWFKFDNFLAPNQDQYIFSIAPGLALKKDKTTNKVVAQFDNAGVVVSVPVPDSISRDVWYHAVLTLTNTELSVVLNSANSAFVYTVHSQSFTLNSSIGSVSKLYLGSDSTTIAAFAGEMDNLRIYNKPLTSGEVQSLYDKAPISLPNFYQPLRFREGDELRFLTKFTFTNSGFTTNSGISTNPTYTLGNEPYVSVSSFRENTLLQALNIIPDERVVEFRLTISG